MKGKIPLDGGMDFFDGERILGDGKTVEGTIGGTLIGTFAGIIQWLLQWVFGVRSGFWVYGSDWTAVIVIAAIAFGALFGDVLASFIKRRLKRERGAKFRFLDQFDLIAGVFIISFIVPFSHRFFLVHYVLDWHWISIISILFFTYVFHRLSNVIAYKIGVKKVPW